MVTGVTAYVRTLNAGLPRAVYVLQSGLVLNALGNGAAAPFLVIYLHDVRGLSLAVAGLAGSTAGTCALVAALGAGALGDRYGARRTMIGGLLLSTAAYVLYPLVREPWHAFALAALAGSGIGTWLTMQSSLLAALTPPSLRHAAFAQQRVAANLGLGLGGMAAGLLVVVAEPATFTRLFLFNAATFVLYATFVLRLPAAPIERPATAAGGGYRSVLADRGLAAVAAINLLLVTAGVSLFAALFPVFAHNDVGVGARTIGVLFLLNSLLIILVQLPIARAHEGHRRMHGLALTAAAFALTWILVLVAAAVGVRAATAVLVCAVLVFAIGECLYDAVQGPLVADLAPAHARGRYMAVSGFSWQLGFIAGPGLGGIVLAAAGGWLWVAAAVVCCTAAAASLALERLVPEAARRTPRRDEE
jgi:MFS family permease